MCALSTTNTDKPFLLLGIHLTSLFLDASFWDVSVCLRLHWRWARRRRHRYSHILESLDCVCNCHSSYTRSLSLVQFSPVAQTQGLVYIRCCPTTTKTRYSRIDLKVLIPVISVFDDFLFVHVGECTNVSAIVLHTWCWTTTGSVIVAHTRDGNNNFALFVFAIGGT